MTRVLLTLTDGAPGDIVCCQLCDYRAWRFPDVALELDGVVLPASPGSRLSSRLANALTEVGSRPPVEGGVLQTQVQPAAYKMAVPFGATPARRRMAVPASVWVTDWRRMAVPASVWVTDWRRMAVPATVWVAPAAKTGSAIPAAAMARARRVDRL